MKIGLFRPTSLLGQEIRERLTGTLGTSVEWTLLGTGDEIGTVTEIGRTPALVEDADAVDVAALDLLITCSATAEELDRLAATGAERPIVLQVAAETVCAPGVPMVAGLSPPSPERSLVAAHAITIVLSHALEALEDLGPRSLTSTVLLPVSVHGRGALDEVLDQARALLAFQEMPPAEVLGAQLAFNLLPPADQRVAPSPEDLASELAAVYGREIDATYGLLYAGVFHGFGILCRVELSEEASSGEVRRRLLASSRLIEAPHGDVGPIDTASREEVMVGAVTQAGSPKSHWLWLLADNLVLTAANAVAIVESLALDTRPDRAN